MFYQKFIRRPKKKKKRTRRKKIKYFLLAFDRPVNVTNEEKCSAEADSPEH